jgi:broad specificity phosphatase PhoE
MLEKGGVLTIHFVRHGEVIVEACAAGGDWPHKATIRIIACALLGIDIDLYRARLAQPVASFTSFSFPPSGPLLQRLGEVARGQD